MQRIAEPSAFSSLKEGGVAHIAGREEAQGMAIFSLALVFYVHLWVHLWQWRIRCKAACMGGPECWPLCGEAVRSALSFILPFMFFALCAAGLHACTCVRPQ